MDPHPKDIFGFVPSTLKPPYIGQIYLGPTLPAVLGGRFCFFEQAVEGVNQVRHDQVESSKR